MISMAEERRQRVPRCDGWMSVSDRKNWTEIGQKKKTTNTRKKGSSRNSHNRGEEQIRKKGDTKLKSMTLGAPPPLSRVPVFSKHQIQDRTALHLSLSLSLSLWFFAQLSLIGGTEGRERVKSVLYLLVFLRDGGRERFLFFRGGILDAKTRGPARSTFIFSARLLTSSSFGTTCRKHHRRRNRLRAMPQSSLTAHTDAIKLILCLSDDSLNCCWSLIPA